MKTWRIREKSILKLSIVLIIIASLLTVPHTKFYNQNFAPIASMVVSGITEKIHFNATKAEVSKYDTQYVYRYIELNKEIEELEDLFVTLTMIGEQHQDVQNQIEELKEKRDQITPYAEAVVEKQIAHMAERENLTIFSSVVPRPLVQFTETPYMLIISPRDRIERKTSWMVEETSIYQFEQLEKQAEKDYPDSSALVVRTGGLGVIYPAQVRHRSNLRSLLRTSTHEWIHQYLFFATPLGRRYLAEDDRMRIINESVTAIGDREIGDAIYEHFYTRTASMGTENIELASANTDSETEEVGSFNEFMRETRVTVDAFLEEGEIEKAEEYMQERQRILVENGYTTRKINQAYFAFHGAYATRDSVPDPLGDAIQELREKTDSLSEFYSIIGEVKSLQDFKDIMSEHGIDYES